MLLCRPFAFSLLALFTFAATAMAAPVATGVEYTLNNHPDGNAAEPFYGLRLDGLDGDRDSTVTFDFEAAGADMRMLYDGASLRIFGTALGGVDVGAVHQDPQLFEIDFSYRVVSDVGSELVVTTAGMGTGTIAATETLGSFSAGETFKLVDTAGRNPFSFKLTSGHRDFAGLSGYGWLNHSVFDSHVYSSDWLFTVGAPVPEPGAALLFGMGALWVGRRGRTRR